MEPSPERSKRLHNFHLPHLRWGQQRFLRCVNLSSTSHHRSPPPPSSFPNHAANRSAGVSNEMLRGGESKGEVLLVARPWNLRTRRAACSVPGDESASKIAPHVIGVKRGVDENGNEKLKFIISLSKEEIEEDFSTIFGKKLPRRPKKRPRIVQKKLDTIFPGLWLNEEVTTDSYNVTQVRET